MSTDELRRELTRIADAAPVADVPADTWSQARRSVGKQRVAVVAAAAAVAGVVAAGATWLPDQVRPPVADNPAGAVPTRIWTLPDDEHAEEGDLALGTASAAYLADEFELDVKDPRVVVVTARDGGYHVVHLPDLRPNTGDITHPNSLALSPDGRQLAYLYALGDGVLPTVGIAFLDLRTGQVREVPLAGPAPRRSEDRYPSINVRTMSWSPSGTYLLWRGQKAGLGTYGDTVAGLIGPDGDLAALPPEDQDDLFPAYAVGDDGTVVILTRTSTRTWREGEVVASGTPPDASRNPWAAQLRGGVVAQIRTPFPADPGESADTMTYVHGDEDPVVIPDRISSVPSFTDLGWAPDGSLLYVRGDPDQTTVDLSVYELRFDDGEVTAHRVVAMEPGRPPGQLTLAVDLPFEELPAPDWVPDHRPLYTGLGAAGVVLLLAAGWWLWRRRRDPQATAST